MLSERNVIELNREGKRGKEGGRGRRRREASSR